MKTFEKLLKKKEFSLIKNNGEFKTSGEIIAESTDGANLIDGKQTWEHAVDKKHDIDYMKRCCDAEIKTMKMAGLVPAPYYFERVAILSSKEKNYQQEVMYCEMYIEAVEGFYRKGTSSVSDVRNGPRYKAIANRLLKARKLLKNNN
jgi:hypothetical protein